MFLFFSISGVFQHFDSKEDVSWREEFDGKCLQEFAG
jgi:hypothetical protein